MPITCRLLALDAAAAASLSKDPGTLARHAASCDTFTELYYFWHGIDYLLARSEAPEAARCLRFGGTEIPSGPGLPVSRLHQPAAMPVVATRLAAVPAEDLVVAYDPEALDSAGVYPERWVALSEESDLLGDLLEHYRYLQQFTARRKQDRRAMLVLYERIKDDSGF